MRPYVLTSVAAVSLVGFSAHGQSIPASFRLVDLGGLPGSYATHPEGINNQAEVVGWTHGPQTRYRAFRWTALTGLVELPPPPGYTHNRAMDISENGIICGVAQNSFDGPTRSWRMVGGVYELLPETFNGCQYLFATAVNNDGTVVGTFRTTGPCPSTFYSFYYSDADGLVPMPVLTATDINNSGVATGEGFGSAYRFTPQTGVVSIGSLPAPYDDAAEGRAINEAGDVAGRSIDHITGLDPWKAFFHSDGQGMIETSPTLSSRRSAEALNNFGHAVGSDGTTTSPEKYPWIWSPASGRVDLTTRVVLPADYFNLDSPRGINDRDQIVAKALRSDGPEVYAAGVLLVPAPPMQSKPAPRVFTVPDP